MQSTGNRHRVSTTYVAVFFLEVESYFFIYTFLSEGRILLKKNTETSFGQVKAVASFYGT